MFYGDVTRNEMLRMGGFVGLPKREWFEDPRYGRIHDTTGGLARINTVQRNNPDSAYHGIDIGPKDADKALLR